MIFHCGKVMIPGRPSTCKVYAAAETKFMIHRTAVNEDLKGYTVGEN